MAKRIRAEIMPRDRGEEIKRMIARAVEERVAEALSGSDEAIFLFQPRAVGNEIKRRRTVTEQQKFPNVFEDYGCLVCGTRDIHFTATSCWWPALTA